MQRCYGEIGVLPALFARAALTMGRPESEILTMLANGCDSAANARRALAQMERFEATTRPTHAGAYLSQHARYEAEAALYERLGRLIRAEIPPPDPPAQRSLFAKV